VRWYSTREVAELSGLDEKRVRGFARAGLLAPGRDAGGRYRYSFQDLALLRTAARLVEARISPRRITRALRLIRARFPERPLSAVRISVDGGQVVVRDRLSSWEPESGQGTLDFDVRDLSRPVAAHLPRPSAREPVEQNAVALYQCALDLDLAGRTDEACAAYRAALEREPGLAAAHINLGRLLHAAKRLAEAEAEYRAALEQEPRTALAAFNLGVALEDQGKLDAAREAYRLAISIDGRYADAHFNLSRLLEAEGDSRGALRHLNTFRRLLRGDA
jgi:tetratricopeptide (TPR) repeat protein